MAVGGGLEVGLGGRVDATASDIVESDLRHIIDYFKIKYFKIYGETLWLR